MHMLLDVNTEIYPMDRKEKFLLALSPSLVLNTKVNLMLILFVVPCYIIFLSNIKADIYLHSSTLIYALLST